MSRDELLDWLALWEVDPWGPDRDDLRAGVQSVWNLTGSFNELKIQYPHIEADSDEVDAEIEALLDQDANELEFE